YTIQVSSDGQFGSPKLNEAGEQVWSGAIGDLISGTADVAVGTLVITYDREGRGLHDTFHGLGLSVIMKKPEQQTDPLQFMLPFSGRVWTCMLLAWLLTSLLMLVCARLSPYEWYSHNDCVPVVENQFGALNSMWFTIGSLMQQGSELAPRASSTRMVATTWWFFTLLLISSYTANLALFSPPAGLGTIDSVEALASQSKVKFGCPIGGAMYNFFKDFNTAKHSSLVRNAFVRFQNSRIPLYRRMWDSMVSWSAKNESFVLKTSEGIGRVREGGYAYILESTFNQYYRERDCELTQIGGIFKSQQLRVRSTAGQRVSQGGAGEVILQLHKEQFIEDMSNAWIKRFNLTGPPCSEAVDDASPTGTMEVASFGGVFIALMIGLGVAVLLCFVELLWRCRTLALRTRPVDPSVLVAPQLGAEAAGSELGGPQGFQCAPHLIATPQRRVRLAVAAAASGVRMPAGWHRRGGKARLSLHSSAAASAFAAASTVSPAAATGVGALVGFADSTDSRRPRSHGRAAQRSHAEQAAWVFSLMCRRRLHFFRRPRPPLRQGRQVARGAGANENRQERRQTRSLMPAAPTSLRRGFLWSAEFTTARGILRRRQISIGTDRAQANQLLAWPGAAARALPAQKVADFDQTSGCEARAKPLLSVAPITAEALGSGLGQQLPPVSPACAVSKSKIACLRRGPGLELLVSRVVNYLRLRGELEGAGQLAKKRKPLLPASSLKAFIYCRSSHTAGAAASLLIFLH
uniref:PBPe domain-containing protein n=1 Tax=Macrostomum lignano TaxID=282301 RepID=A0A1I8FBV1_9PLAT